MILSNPKNGWCNFRLKAEEEFCGTPSYLTDVMYDTAKMCLTYLQTGTGAVTYDQENAGTFIFILSDYGIYVIAESTEEGEMKVVSFPGLHPEDVCQDILDSYYADKYAWIDFANMEPTEELRVRYKYEEESELHIMIEEIRRLMIGHFQKKSKWQNVRCSYLNVDENSMLVEARKNESEEYFVVAKILENGEIVYLDKDAKDDWYVQEVIKEGRKFGM